MRLVNRLIRISDITGGCRFGSPHSLSKKSIRRAVPEASKIYSEQLLNEINEDREDHGKKPFDGGNPPKEKVITESKTDPECGVFHKGEHKKCFAYTAQTACDKNGYVLDVTVNAGNVHDSVASYGQRRIFQTL